MKECIGQDFLVNESQWRSIGRKVQVVYDPADITVLTIEYEGHGPLAVRELVIEEWSGKRPVLPDHMLPEVAEASRLLRAAEQQKQQRKERQAPAVSYRTVWKETDNHV